MQPFHLFLLPSTIWAYNLHEDSLRFCESYAECNAVALLEERLCLGNSRLRPYWLPESHDPKGCHDKLKNDYKILEKMEEDLENQFISCLIDNSVLFNESQNEKCTQSVLRDTPRFSYGRTITYVPTNCFTGLERRRERECGAVKNCCKAYSKCQSMLTESSLANSIETTAVTMRKRAKDCEKGLVVDILPIPDYFGASYDTEQAWAPKGHVNVNFKDLETEKKKQDRQRDGSGLGYVNVRFWTASNESVEDKARRVLLRSGDEKPGEVSKPLGGQKSKAEFPKLNGINNVNKNKLTVSDRDLVIALPPLSFPDDSAKIINDGDRKNDKLPKDQIEHDSAFNHALNNTIEYKKRIELERGATGHIVEEGLNSLLEAVKVSEATHQMGIASGSVKKMDSLVQEGSEFLSGTEIVTSSPIIFVKKDKISKILRKEFNGGCRAKAFSSKTRRLEEILTMLGEKSDSEDMKEINELIDTWQNNFRKKVVSAKEKAKNKEIAKALDQLISHFDDVNLQLIKSNINATFTEDEYPHEDAELTANECNPLPIDVDEENNVTVKEEEKEVGTIQEELVDEHGDKIIVENGLEKIVLSRGDLVVEKSEDTHSKEISIEDKEKESDSNVTQWSNEEYQRELKKFREEHHIEIDTRNLGRNETSCDLYMRCRNQMHLAIDGCAWRFASSKVISSLAESAESLLYKGEELCDPFEQPMYEELYEMVIQRNIKLRNCLDKKNEVFFTTSVCLPYESSLQHVYDEALLRVLSSDYKISADCFRDANLIQEKCTKLRDCCPNYDECREMTMDITIEEAIISKTAQINENKQNCLKTKAREAFKITLKDLLGKDGRQILRKIKNGDLDLELVKTAKLIRRMK